MRTAAATAKRLSLGLPIIAAVAACGLGFRAVPEAAAFAHLPSRSFSTHHHDAFIVTEQPSESFLLGCYRPPRSSSTHQPLPSRRRSGSSWALGGYYQSNDYFSSFGNSDDSEDGSSTEEGGDDDRRKEGKYIGHGRIGGGGDEGGVFDINNYFSSFGNDDEAEVSAGIVNFDPSQPSAPDEYQPPQKMREMTYEEIVAYNNARLCPKMLLTQRSIQSFIYLLEECRDPHSGKWIEDFLGLQNLGNYHGTGALNVTRYRTWDSVLYDIMRQPNDKMIVSAKRRGRGHGGWSKNNPYLEERWVEFKIDIRPATLVQRLLPVRAQIAEEFRSDLDIVQLIDGTIMDSYFEKLRDEDPSSTSATTFDRIAAEALTNATEAQSLESSPFRRGNFDLLYALCTQAAAHRFLREQQSTSASHPVGNDATFPWFKQFYLERVPEYFDGDQSFGRADDFMDALLRTPPSLVETSDGRTVGLTDPLRIAERIIALRSEIAGEWKAMMGEVPQDHLQLNNVLFRIMMGRTIDESGNDVVEIQEEKTLGELSDSAGAFE